MLRGRGVRRRLGLYRPVEQGELERPERTWVTPAPRHACLAPSVQLYLTPDGDVRVCCRNSAPLGNVMVTPLLELWRGAAHRDVVGRLAAEDYSAGCQQCHGETLVEGRTRAYPANFDSFTEGVERFGDEAGLRWPSRLEFNLSNACNLMCIQCNGLLSSAIRAHRDHLPALPDAYGEVFFADIEQFIPHLTEAQFAGGEPFMAKENFRVWELIEKLNPTLKVIVVTNATQWNRRVDDITDRVRMGFTFSIDAISKDTYESIRVNARHEVTMANVDRYIAKAQAWEMPLEVNFCLMQQNYQEFPEIMLWAEERGIKVNASIVRNPVDCSLPALPVDELAAVVELWEAADDRVRPFLGDENRPVWDDELARLRAWRDADGDARRGLYWEALIPLPTRKAAEVVPAMVTEADREAVRSWVADLVPGGDLHTLELIDASDGDERDGGADDDGEDAQVVQSFSSGLAAILDVDASQLIGAPVETLVEHLQRRFGTLQSSVESTGPGGSTETELTFEHARVRAGSLPVADAAGTSVVLAVLAG